MVVNADWFAQLSSELTIVKNLTKLHRNQFVFHVFEEY